MRKHLRFLIFTIFVCASTSVQPAKAVTTATEAGARGQAPGGSQAQLGDPRGCCRPCKVICQPCDPCECKATAQTFFSIRPLYQVASPEYTTLFHNSRMYERHGGRDGAFQVVLFGGRSTEAHNLARFFMPFCKSELLVTEDNDPSEQPFTPDILAGFFNIATSGGDFSSRISFRPVHHEVGLGFTYKQAFCPREDGREFWFEISAPLTHVRNSMNFCEEILNDGGGADSENCGYSSGGYVPFVPEDSVDKPVANMTEAFRQKAWECGKIDCLCPQKKTRLANIDVMVGFETVKREDCYLESYLGVSLPTGNRVTGCYVFEPIVGHNHHFGVMFGSNMGFDLWKGCEGESQLWAHFTLHGMYLVRNCQKRLLDLKCKPWSRYMRVYKDLAQAEQASDTFDPCLHTPGVNVFCQDLRVHPGFQRTYNTALEYTCGNFQAEAGYNFFCRSPECVQLKCPWQEGPALIAYEAGGNLSAGDTDPVQQINTTFPSCEGSPTEPNAISFTSNPSSSCFYNNNVIKQCDLDLESAAHPGVATHTLFAALGWNFDACCYPSFVGFGGSYEIARDNTGLSRWTAWGKYGMSF